jgi:RNA polymerase sigma-70 factor (ECF subfamily)
VERPRTEECVRAFREHFAFVYRSLRRYGARPADLDDLVQEVFVVLWRQWASFDPQRPLRPWLAGIAFRVARRHVRRHAREVVECELDPVDGAPDGEARLASARARDLVLAALARLPERHREPLIMHELDEISVNDMAELLEVPLATVYTRVRRARQAFMKAVNDLTRGRAAAIAPTALLGIERTPPEPPPEALLRGEGRVRQLLQQPSLPPDPLAGQSARWTSGRPLVARVLTTAAIGLVAATTLLLGLPRREQVAAPASAPVTTGASGALPGVRAIERATPVFLAVAPRSLQAPPPPVSLSAGLAGYWRLEDGPGGATARDSSGLGRDCVVHDLAPPAAWIDGPQGRALDLRAKGWLECPLPDARADGPVALTVAAWVKRWSGKIPAALVTRQLGQSYRDQFFFGFAADGLRVVSHAWKGWSVLGQLPSQEQWFHAAFTHDGGTTRLFVDGVEVARSQGRVMPQGELATSFTIGAGRYGKKPTQVRQRFDGAIDEILVYDRALAPEEVRALASGATPR